MATDSPANRAQRKTPVDGPLAPLERPDERPDERRQWPRVQLDLQIRLTFESTDEVIATRTLDISRGGAFVRVPAAGRPRGTRTRLLLIIGEQTLDLRGTLVRITNAGVGIQFDILDPASAKIIDQLVRARAQQR